MMNLFRKRASRSETEQASVPRKGLAALFTPASGPGVASRRALNETMDAVADRMRAFRLFNPESYTRMNPDTAGVDPLQHYLHFGMFENRTIADARVWAKIIGEKEIGLASPPALALEGSPGLGRSFSGTVGIYCSSLGNSFMTEIADDLAATLEEAGATVVRGDETGSPRETPPLCLVVAPHEFFLLGRGREWGSPEFLRKTVTYGTEQVQTPWFWKALPYVFAARGHMDVSHLTAGLVAEVMPAIHARPGVKPRGMQLSGRLAEHPLLGAFWWDVRTPVSPETLLADRPLDLAFFGAAGPHRERFFARNARLFSDWDCCIYLRKRNTPLSGQSVEGDLSRIARYVGLKAKITLNLHRDAFGYFEWHRMVHQGMASGAMVVSETCRPVPGFTEGLHYLCENARHLGNLLDWLLHTPDGRAKAESCRRNCLDTLSLGRLGQTGGDVLGFLAQMDRVR